MKATGATDVTLATQLTVDRFPALERMLSSWSAPASVVLHISDAELESITGRIQSSKALRRRTNVAIHLVYRRLVFNSVHTFNAIRFILFKRYNCRLTSYALQTVPHSSCGNFSHEQHCVLCTWASRLLLNVIIIIIIIIMQPPYSGKAIIFRAKAKFFGQKPAAKNEKSIFLYLF